MPEAPKEWRESLSPAEEMKQLQEQIKKMQQRLEALQKQAWGNWWKKTPEVTKVGLASVKPGEIDNKLYWWGRGKEITKDEVMQVVNALKEPYNTDVSNFIKKGDILGLQKYLNGKIKSWEIDLAKVTAALKKRNIPFNGSIIEDGKFGPQTLETIKFVLKEQKETMGPDLDWIPQEMSAVMKDVKHTRRDMNWSPERNIGEDNFNVDTKRHIISITTWGTSLNSPEREHVPWNRCEINWDTGAITVVCNNRKYEMPIHIKGFKLKNWYPDGNDINNRERVRAFATVWNLMNHLKAHAVYNWQGAIEEASWTIELNDSPLGLFDTDIVSARKFDEITNEFSHLWVKFDKETRVQTASLLSAMKLDLWKIKWTPDIESGSRGRKNPLDDEHIKWVKHYSQTYWKKTK